MYHEETVNEDVNWINPERDKAVAGFSGAFAKLPKSVYSFAMSARLSAWNSSPPSGRIFMKFDSIFRKSIEKTRFINI
jgi:hypothetical protein